MLFKAMIMCEDCGEIHAEKWLESSNRHATTTTLFVLCESCKMNQFLPVDSFLFADDECKECGCFDHQHHAGCSEDFDPFESMEEAHNGGDYCFLCTKKWDKCECFND